MEWTTENPASHILLTRHPGPEISIACGPAISPALFTAYWKQWARGTFRYLGIPAPRLRITRDDAMPFGSYRAEWNGDVLATADVGTRGSLRPLQYYTACLQAMQQDMAPPPLDGVNVFVPDEMRKGPLAAECIALSDLSFRLLRILPALLPYDLVEEACAEAENHPGRGHIDRMYAHAVMMTLLDERVSLAPIIETAYLTRYYRGASAHAAAERIRALRRRAIIKGLVGTDITLAVLRFNSNARTILRRAAAQLVPMDSTTAVEPLRQELFRQLPQVFRLYNPHLAVVVPETARRLVRSWVKAICPEVPVLCEHDVENTAVNCVAII